MAYVDQKLLDMIWRIMESKINRQLLRAIGNTDVVTYTEMQKIINRNKNLTAHYVKRLVGSGMMMSDDRHYFLTRLGIQCKRLCMNFDDLCFKLDLSDLDMEGKVKKMVIRPIEVA